MDDRAGLSASVAKCCLISARLTSHSLKPRLKSFQEVVGLPKLNGKIINASLGETPGFFRIQSNEYQSGL
jgi:hypothetical protein